MATTKKATKKAKPNYRYWAVKGPYGVEVYRTGGTIPILIPTGYAVKSKGHTLSSITDLCSQATPLFKNLQAGELKEFTVKVEAAE